MKKTILIVLIVSFNVARVIAMPVYLDPPGITIPVNSISATSDSTRLHYMAEAAVNNAGLRALFENYLAALQQVPQAASLPDPELMFQYFINPMESDGVLKQFSFGVSQMFPWFGTRKALGNSAEWQAQAAYYRFEEKKLSLFRDVSVGWFRYVMLHHHYYYMMEHLDWVERLVVLTQLRVDAGTANRIDLLRLQIEKEEIKAEIVGLSTEIRSEQAIFNNLLNKKSNAPIQLPVHILPEDISASSVDGSQIAQAGISGSMPDGGMEKLLINPARLADEAELQVMLAMAAAARLQSYPMWGLSLEVMGPNSAMQMPGNRVPVFAGVRFTLPVWRGKYRAIQQEASARTRSAEWNLVETDRYLQSALAELTETLANADEKIDLYRNRLLPIARERTDLMVFDLSGGRARIEEVIAARRMTLDYTMKLEEALLERNRVIAELERILATYNDFKPEEL